MNSPKLVGYFRELNYGKQDAVSILDARDKISVDKLDPILNYLEKGEISAVSPILSFDFFDSKVLIGPLLSKTDGNWIWTSDLSYYVRKYRVALPEEFINHILKHSSET